MFNSILFPMQSQHVLNDKQPSFFKDLNIDQLLYPLLSDKKAYTLHSVFYTPLRDVETIEYRHEILRELEDVGLRTLFARLSDVVYATNSTMINAGEQLMSIRSTNFDGKMYNNYFANGNILRCIENYCVEIINLTESISSLELFSTGLSGFSEYLKNYSVSPEFKEMQSHAVVLREKLGGIQYSILLKDKKGGPRSKTIRIRKYDGEEEYSENLRLLFEKFNQSDGTTYIVQVPEVPVSIEIENIILKMVANTHREVFGELNNFCVKYLKFMDETILRFACEIQFYFGWHELIAPMTASGLRFCCPKVITGEGDIFMRGMFDIALASRKRGVGIVTNDFKLTAPERIVIITGPNQGGKTTFSRAFSQIHYLASLGVSVPGEDAQLILCDNILTHFGRQENIYTQSGQLQDDLIRLKELLDAATSRSVIVINEIFASTTVRDALSIGRHMLKKLEALGAPALVITFLDELTDYGENIISLVATVDDENSEKRTYKFVRKRPDSTAYAIHIAKKYGMTFEMINEKLSYEKNNG